MLVEQLAGALEALSAAAEPWVGTGWREVPSYTLFFGAVFLLSLPFYVRCCPAVPWLLCCVWCCGWIIVGALLLNCALGWRAEAGYHTLPISSPAVRQGGRRHSSCHTTACAAAFLALTVHSRTFLPCSHRHIHACNSRQPRPRPPCTPFPAPDVIPSFLPPAVVLCSTMWWAWMAARLPSWPHVPCTACTARCRRWVRLLAAARLFCLIGGCVFLGLLLPRRCLFHSGYAVVVLL